MLILGRRIGQAIIIQDNIHVRLLSTKGDQIRIGIDAPKDVSVHREEIYQKIKMEKDLKEEKR